MKVTAGSPASRRSAYADLPERMPPVTRMRAIGGDSIFIAWPAAAGLALGFAADRVLGDPQRGHPVAGFGRVADSLERRTYADCRIAGVGHVVILVGAAGALGLIMERIAAEPAGVADQRSPRQRPGPCSGVAR